MTEPVSTAQCFPWDGGAVFVGMAGVFPEHAHQAIQICFLFDGRIRLRPSDDAPWADFDVAIVPSQHSHAMDGARTQYGATLFVEPETREGRVLTESYLGSGIANIERATHAAAVRELHSAALERRGGAMIAAAARRLVQSLTQHTEPAVTSDQRIVRALQYVNERLADSITLEQVASVAFLSPSRFRHLFVEQTGMGLREYVLWRRFVKVWELRMQGASLSAAAHAAGFADSAHLTRTSRAMFGIPPSLMEVAASSAESDEAASASPPAR
jgi:AraC-like DNA-binding protein